MKIGQRVFCVLYGGKMGVIVAIHGEPRPASCKAIGGVGVTGGNADVNIIWDDGTASNRIPECLVRGSVQWRLYDDIWSAEQIEAAKARLAAEAARRAAEAAAKEEGIQLACAALKLEYPSLLTSEHETAPSKRAVANIRKLLKLTWPTVKFSVTKPESSVRVAWRDGPTSKQVSALVDRFEEGHFNGMADIYEYRDTAWTRMFGGVKFASCSRTVTASVIQRSTDVLWLVLGNLRDIPKPEVDDAFFTRTYGQVPGLDVRIEEVVQSLTSHYDAVTAKFVADTSYGRAAFVVAYALEMQAAGNLPWQ